MDLLRINRPEYFGSPEVVLSSLAWSVSTPVHGSDAGRVFEDTSGKRPTRVKVEQTKTLLRGIAAEVVRKHVKPPIDPDSLVEPLLDGLSGVTPANAKFVPAVPLTRSAAFLQDASGTKKKRNPANYAGIVERFYQLGADAPVDSTSAARLWVSAVSGRESIGPYACLEDISTKIAPRTDECASQTMVQPPRWLRELRTPFHWFHRAWRCYCEAGWKGTLPRRRWCDWGCCILRTAFGMAFLWEAQFYEWLKKRLLGEDGLPPPGTPGNEWVLPWHDPASPLTARDVNGLIKRSLTRGDEVRRVLQQVEGIDEHEIDDLPLEGLVVKLRGKLQQVGGYSALLDAIASSSGVNNTIETVVYSLQCRAETGSEADFYSLLRRRSRRFLVVEPGPEWIVVIASLAAGSPGRSTTADTVTAELRLLGIEPKREHVVPLLERAGLSRGSHDADLALEVAAAF